MKSVQHVLVVLALVLALAGLIGAVVSGFGTRLGFWEFGTGFSVLKWSVYAAIAAVLLAAVSAILAVPAGTRLLDARLVAAAVVGLAVFSVTYSFAHKFKKTPTVADAATNIEDPPVFVALVAVREQTARNPLAYRRDEAADLQRRYFPELTEAVEFNLPPDEVIRLAATVAEEMGFEIVDVDPLEGRLEATDTTFWYGFKDDIVVRARQADGRTRIDVRSASRVGYLDGGLNARRIQKFLQKLAAGMN